MKIMIVDDNQKFAIKLKKDLLIYFDKLDESVDFSIYTDNFSKIHFSSEYKIIFLDIDLINISGIDLAKKINIMNPKCIIVFISAHNHLVYNALVVKPFFFIRKSNYEKDLSIFFDLINDLFKEKLIINISYKANKTSLPIDSIIYVEALNHMLKITSCDRVYYDNRSLKAFLSLMPDKDFCQIHKSYVINLNYLLLYARSTVTMINDIHLTVGRAYKKNFDLSYQEFLIR